MYVVKIARRTLSGTVRTTIRTTTAALFFTKYVNLGTCVLHKYRLKINSLSSRDIFLSQKSRERPSLVMQYGTTSSADREIPRQQLLLPNTALSALCSLGMHTCPQGCLGFAAWQ